MVRIPEVPGIEVQLLEGIKPKAEYASTMFDYDDDNDNPEWPRKCLSITVKNNEPIHIRISIFPAFPHLTDCQGIMFIVLVDGKQLFRTRPRTEFMIEALHKQFKRSFDHNMREVIRYDEGQRRTRVPRFVPLEIVNDSTLITERDLGTIRVQAFRINWWHRRVQPRIKRTENSLPVVSAPRAPRTSSRSPLTQKRTAGRDAATQRKLTHAVRLTGGAMTSQRASLKTKVGPKSDPTATKRDGEYLVSEPKCIEKTKKGKPKAFFEVVFRYRAADKLREFGVDVPEEPYDSGDKQEHSFNSLQAVANSQEGTTQAVNGDAEMTDEGYDMAATPEFGNEQRSILNLPPTLDFSSIASVW